MSTTNKPKSLLPDGSVNPEYTRWYNSTEAGKAARRRYNQSEKAKAARKRYNSKVKFDGDRYADRIIYELKAINAQLY
jgi:hypothetical protein